MQPLTPERKAVNTSHNGENLGSDKSNTNIHGTNSSLGNRRIPKSFLNSVEGRRFRWNSILLVLAIIMKSSPGVRYFPNNFQSLY